MLLLIHSAVSNLSWFYLNTSMIQFSVELSAGYPLSVCFLDPVCMLCISFEFSIQDEVLRLSSARSTGCFSFKMHNTKKIWVASLPNLPAFHKGHLVDVTAKLAPYQQCWMRSLLQVCVWYARILLTTSECNFMVLCCGFRLAPQLRAFVCICL